MGNSRPHIVLVHGSWLGGWCWEAVRRCLHERGLETSAPTLTGLGDRAHLGSADTALSDHVEDVLVHLDFIQADKVVVVGHSYGGAVAAEVAAAKPDRVKQLIVVDGFVLKAGESIFMRYPPLKQLFDSLLEPRKPGYAVPPDAEFLGLPAGSETDRILKLLRAMPIRTHEEACQFGADAVSGFRSYVRFSLFPFFTDLASEVSACGWQATEVEAGHLGMFSASSSLAACIDELVE